VFSPYFVNQVRRFVRFLEDRDDILIVYEIVDMDQHLLRYAEQLASLGFNRLSQRRLRTRRSPGLAVDKNRSG